MPKCLGNSALIDIIKKANSVRCVCIISRLVMTPWQESSICAWILKPYTDFFCFWYVFLIYSCIANIDIFPNSASYRDKNVLRAAYFCVFLKYKLPPPPQSRSIPCFWPTAQMRWRSPDKVWSDGWLASTDRRKITTVSSPSWPTG